MARVEETASHRGRSIGSGGSDLAEEPAVQGCRAGHAGFESFPLVLPGLLSAASGGGVGDEVLVVVLEIPARTWSIEGADGRGFQLAQQFVAGEHVLNVPTTLAARTRVLGSGRTPRATPTTRCRLRSRRCGHR